MNQPIVDQMANTVSPKIRHRVVIEMPVEILSDRNLDKYSATAAVYENYPGAVVLQVTRLADG